MDQRNAGVNGLRTRPLLVHMAGGTALRGHPMVHSILVAVHALHPPLEVHVARNRVGRHAFLRDAVAREAVFVLRLADIEDAAALLIELGQIVLRFLGHAEQVVVRILVRLPSGLQTLVHAADNGKTRGGRGRTLPVLAQNLARPFA